MAEPSLEGPRLRLSRADAYLGRLEREVAAYMDGQPYLIPDQLDVEGEWRVQRLKVLKQPDPTWALLVSEVIHHLRSALDNLVWQLVLLNDSDPGCRNQFPIYTKPSRPGRMDTMLAGVRDDHRAFIEAIQPHPSPDTATKRALARLVDLSNIDKHRFLQPALAWAHDAPEPSVRVEPPSLSTKLDIRFRRGLLQDGADVFRYRLRASGKGKVYVEGYLPIEIAFGEGWAGGDVLDELRIRVLEVIERFARDFA